jgi:hypothetical protein
MIMKKIIVFVVALFNVFHLVAQDEDPTYDELIQYGGGLNTITTAVPFLLIAPDSRSGAMGDVGAATSPDASSMHWNPAKLAFTDEEIGISMSYVPWLRALVSDISLSYLAGYKRLDDRQVVGFDLRYFSLGDITFTDGDGFTIGQFKPHELAFGGSYARKLTDKFSLAISGRYIYSDLTGGQFASSIPTAAGQAFAADIAGFYSSNIRISKYDMDLSFGCNISNIGNKISYTQTTDGDFIPINLRLGTALEADIDDYNSISFAVDMNKLLVPTPPLRDQSNSVLFGKEDQVGVVSGIFQSFGDAPGGIKEELREINYSIGSEYWYANQFAIRAGYFFEHATKGGRKFYTFGSGVKYSSFVLDFSYLMNANREAGGTNPLANTMRFTMTWDFGVKDT